MNSVKLFFEAYTNIKKKKVCRNSNDLKNETFTFDIKRKYKDLIAEFPVGKSGKREIARIELLLFLYYSYFTYCISL
jgi:hypothetical protein